MKKYRITKNTIEMSAKGFAYEAGMTYAAIDVEPEIFGTYDDLSEAREDFKALTSDIIEYGTFNEVRECHLESYMVDEDGNEDNFENIATAPLVYMWVYAPDGDAVNGEWFATKQDAFGYAKDHFDADENDADCEIVFMYVRPSGADDLEPNLGHTIDDIYRASW